ncbi:MAG TPA: BPL-N domain-containing protein [Bryobacteraceae bacterium]|jgi:glutamine amidotransferase-like uncharacterized protein
MGNARIAVKWAVALLISTALTSCRAMREKVPAHAEAPILLFAGAGTSRGDVAAIRQILAGEQLSYLAVDSAQLNEISESQLREYRLVLVPGGNFEVIGRRLTAGTTAKIRSAIYDGTNYLGVCAGAFFAGNSPYNGLNLTGGPRFGFYAAEARGIRKAAVAITSAGGQIHDQYWEDGPQLTGWGAVVDRYPDGTPATAEGKFGAGWVILTGFHPEAPESWRRRMDFKTPAAINHAYAATVIRAALNREPLPHF